MRPIYLRPVLGALLLVSPLACQRPTASDVKAVSPVGTIAYIRIPTHYLTPAFVKATGFDRDHRRDAVFAFGYLKRDVLERLPAAVFQDVVELDPQAWAHHDFDPRTLELRESTADKRADAQPAEDFHNYEALTAELQRLANAHPETVTLESAGKSVEGRDLWLLKVAANVQQDDGRPKLLYIANMHGDETVGRELLIYLARELSDGYGTDPRMTTLMNAAQIYLMPSMNPDGYEKNQRYNANDVDLNRDFPDFNVDPHDTPDGRAPETAAIMALHAKHHFIMSLNFHGGEVIFNVPWDSKANDQAETRFGDDPLMEQIGRTYADLNPTMKSNTGGSFTAGMTYGYEWYLVNGGMQDWSVYYRNSIHATVELTYTKWPEASDLPARWTENNEGLLRYLEQGLTGMHLKVTDPSGALVNNVTVRVSSANRDVLYPTGLVHRPAIAGAQTVHVSAPGFQAKDVQMTPWKFDGTNYQTVALSPQ
jgi:carboxypeptidase D